MSDVEKALVAAFILADGKPVGGDHMRMDDVAAHLTRTFSTCQVAKHKGPKGEKGLAFYNGAEFAPKDFAAIDAAITEHQGQSVDVPEWKWGPVVDAVEFARFQIK